MLAADFPNRESLCERCGYPLFGLEAGGACPECGLPIAESSPVHRTGPPWQQRMTPGSWIKTFYALVRHPKRTFRAMSFDGSNVAPRVFLLVNATLIGLYWCLFMLLLNPQLRKAWQAWNGAAAVFILIVTLTYIEIVGVAFFSRRRDWRVGFHNAERIACYASPGWVVAVMFLAKLAIHWRVGSVERAWNAWIGPWSPIYALVLGALVFSLAILGFEALVWLGVRQAKYANRMDPIV